MKVRVLGCSGGISKGNKTTSLLVGENIVIDCGTGLADLSIDELQKINHVFITHSHLDHICCLPLLLDIAFGSSPQKTVNVYAGQETINALKEHIFNWKIWPDFTELPNKQHPILQLNPISMTDSISIESVRISPTPANHVVPTFGYHVMGSSSLVFTGDTTVCDELWEVVNKIDNLKYLIIETAFSNDEIELAKLSKHLCPELLFYELGKLKLQPKVFVTHFKPSDEKKILRELNQMQGPLAIKPLRNDVSFSI